MTGTSDEIKNAYFGNYGYWGTYTVDEAPGAHNQDRCARDRARRAHPHPLADQFPRGALVPRRRASARAVHRMNDGASCPDEPPSEADQPQTRCTVSCGTPVRLDRLAARACRAHVQKGAEWCMIRASGLVFLEETKLRWVERQDSPGGNSPRALSCALLQSPPIIGRTAPTLAIPPLAAPPRRRIWMWQHLLR